MNARLKNARKYALKGAACFTPCGVMLGGLAIGFYYIFDQGNLYHAEIAKLAEQYNCRWGSDGIRCSDRPELTATLSQEAADSATIQARADLRALWPAFVAPSLFTGMIIGGIYGFCLRTSPVVDNPEITDANYKLEKDYPDFVDPIHLGIMENPYRLDCGHNLDYTSLQGLIRISEPSVCKCPVCRAEVHEPLPNQLLKEKIENTLKEEIEKRKKPNDKPIEVVVVKDPAPSGLQQIGLFAKQNSQEIQVNPVANEWMRKTY